MEEVGDYPSTQQETRIQYQRGRRPRWPASAAWEHAHARFATPEAPCLGRAPHCSRPGRRAPRNRPREPTSGPIPRGAPPSPSDPQDGEAPTEEGCSQARWLLRVDPATAAAPGRRRHRPPPQARSPTRLGWMPTGQHQPPPGCTAEAEERSPDRQQPRPAAGRWAGPQPGDPSAKKIPPQRRTRAHSAPRRLSRSTRQRPSSLTLVCRAPGLPSPMLAAMSVEPRILPLALAPPHLPLAPPRALRCRRPHAAHCPRDTPTHRTARTVPHAPHLTQHSLRPRAVHLILLWLVPPVPPASRVAPRRVRLCGGQRTQLRQPRADTARPKATTLGRWPRQRPRARPDGLARKRRRDCNRLCSRAGAPVPRK